MGKSATIEEMEAKEDKYRAYLKKIEDDLKTRAKTDLKTKNLEIGE